MKKIILLLFFIITLFAKININTSLSLRLGSPLNLASDHNSQAHYAKGVVDGKTVNIPLPTNSEAKGGRLGLAEVTDGIVARRV